MATMTLNPQYFLAPAEGEQKYPALQASTYTPREGDDVFICLNEKSANKLTEASQRLLGLSEDKGLFKNGSDTIYRISNPYQVVFLGIPSLFCYDKGDKTYSHLVKRIKLAGTKKVTATRLLMAIVCDGKLLTKEDGSIEAFTLKLTSTRTGLLQVIKNIHADLQKEFNAKNNRIIHLFGFSLLSRASLMKSNVLKGEQSWATQFGVSNPIALPDELQMALCQIAAAEETIEFLRDPFFLKQRQAQEQEQTGIDRKSLLDSIVQAGTLLYPKEQVRKAYLTGYVQEKYGKANSSELTIAQLEEMSDDLTNLALEAQEF